VRHFGFLANRCRARRLPEIRAALEAPATATPETEAPAETTLSVDGYPCPRCRRGRLRVRVTLAPQRGDGGQGPP